MVILYLLIDNFDGKNTKYLNFIAKIDQKMYFNFFFAIFDIKSQIFRNWNYCIPSNFGANINQWSGHSRSPPIVWITGSWQRRKLLYFWYATWFSEFLHGWLAPSTDHWQRVTVGWKRAFAGPRFHITLWNAGPVTPPKILILDPAKSNEKQMTTKNKHFWYA